jgi:aconitate hydratase
VSAKDVILEMLRRHGVKGGVGRIIEYHGPGLGSLSAMDRHVIANMGAELGATTSVFPADEQVRAFLDREGRGGDFTEVTADPDASYDITEEIDLAGLEPLIARPSSPGNVVPVREVAGEPVYQVVVGSSANPGLRDFAVLAAITGGHQAHPRVSLDVNPTSRQILADLTAMGGTLSLIKSGARIHQAGCMGCIGMGQAPAIGRNSLRTVPRNFPGRSGTDEDAVWLCSPETAAAAALTGEITDPRDLPSKLGIGYPELVLPQRSGDGETPLEAPLPEADARQVDLVKAPSIGTLPDFDELPADLRARVAIKVGDNISTDEILPAGARVLPFRSDIARLAEFTFSQVDDCYVARARDAGTHVIVAGENYGQGSSREHAVIAPRYLGLRLVIAKSYARIHWQNLANFGVLAVEFADPADYDRIEAGDDLSVDGLADGLGSGAELTVHDEARNIDVTVRHRLSPRQVAMVLAGGQIPLVRSRQSA